MLFNTIEFAFFFALIFVCYWQVFKTVKSQNVFLLGASYFFYGWWDWRFLFLIFVSSLADYTIGRLLGQNEKPSSRKLLLWASIVINLGLLGFFKYYNFFIGSFVDAFSFLGIQLNVTSLNIILPVGISFYTFQTLSYTIDIYRKKIEPTKDVVAFFAFVSFFPQLVAGPIEKARDLLPQFQQKRTFNYNQAVDGMRQGLWGLFKKVVIADNCANYVNEIYMRFDLMPSSMMLLGIFLFTIQVYCDFSGYSDMAIGMARTMNFNLTRNFAYPFFSTSISEFWRRWHITLMSWFREYIYIPLGGSKKGKVRKMLNLFIVFAITGLWHGATGSYVLWGVTCGIVVILSLLVFGRQTQAVDFDQKKYPNLKEFAQMFWVFSLISFPLVFFRGTNLLHVKGYFKGLLHNPFYNELFQPSIFLLLAGVVGLIIIEWRNRTKDHPLMFHPSVSKAKRWFIYYGLAFVIYVFKGVSQDYVYFQF